MKKTTPVILLLAAFWGFAASGLADERAKQLWRSFYTLAEEQQLVDPIRIYEISSDDTTLCFISGNSVYLYANDRIEKVAPAKFLIANRVNRISVTESASRRAFQLWSNERLLLSIGF